MRLLIRNLLAPVLNEANRKRLSRLEYRMRRRISRMGTPLDHQAFRRLLTEQLRVQLGDHLFVHASLGLVNTTLRPGDLLDLLLDLVGPEGSVSAPTFIGQFSESWMRAEDVFDVRETPSGMGQFSEAVRKHPEVRRSLHPTKSVATIGACAKEVVAGHGGSIYQFGPGSPMARLVDRGMRVLGIGVPMSYLTLVHVIEDADPANYPLKVNLPDVMSKTCVDAEGVAHEIQTLVHDMSVVVKADPERFCREHVDPNAWVIFNRCFSPFFMVEAKAYCEAQIREARRGNTVYYD